MVKKGREAEHGEKEGQSRSAYLGVTDHFYTIQQDITSGGAFQGDMSAKGPDFKENKGMSLFIEKGVTCHVSEGAVKHAAITFYQLMSGGRRLQIGRRDGGGNGTRDYLH